MTLLELLKFDLQILNSNFDVYLQALLDASQEFVTREGITLDLTTYEDQMLVVMYAAYLYRKRAESQPVMPRYLRWALNNRLLAQKAGATE